MLHMPTCAETEPIAGKEMKALLFIPLAFALLTLVTRASRTLAGLGLRHRLSRGAPSWMSSSADDGRMVRGRSLGPHTTIGGNGPDDGPQWRSRRPDWLAGHVGLEPANPSASYLIGIT